MIRLSLSLAIVLGAMPALTLSASAVARADTAQAVLDAAPYTLRLDAPCASTLTIEGTAGQNAPTLVGTSSDETPSGLSLSTSGNEAVLTGESCQSSAKLRVAPGTAIKALMHGFGSLHISGVNGPVSITQDGSNDITLDEATALVLETRGFGSLKLGRLNGPATLASMGSSDITIARVDSPLLTATLSGFGSATLQAGTINTLTARIRGSAHLRFDGTVHDADLDASGFGGINLANVTGDLHENAHAPATIAVQRNISHRSSSSATHPILTLPDGTVITARTLVRPDGSVIRFDDPEDASSGDRPYGHHHRWFWGMVLLMLGLLAYRHKDRLGAFASRSIHSSSQKPGKATECENTQVAALQARLTRIDQRLGAVEHCVTSRDFHLHRQFHDLTRRHG